MMDDGRWMDGHKRKLYETLQQTYHKDSWKKKKLKPGPSTQKTEAEQTVKSVQEQPELHSKMLSQTKQNKKMFQVRDFYEYN